MSDIDLAGHDFDAVIFDCDGTLADTAPVHYRAFQTAFAAHGLDMKRAWYDQRVGLSRHLLFEAFARETGATFDAKAIAAESEEVYAAHLGDIRPIEPVAAIARRLHGKMPLAVASAGQRRIVEATLQTIGLRDLFPVIVTVEDVAHGKPAPDLFLLGAEKLGVAPERCLVLEDSDEGLEAARRAGAQPIDVRPALGRTQ